MWGQPSLNIYSDLNLCFVIMLLSIVIESSQNKSNNKLFIMNSAFTAPKIQTDTNVL